jgi:hypothetical protein
MTTTASDTELSAVNSILGSIGQSPITALPNGDLNLANPEIALIHNLLMECNKDVQNEGWHFNQEEHVEINPVNNNFVIPSNYLRFDIHDGQSNRQRDVVVRNGKLWDKVNHTDSFTSSFYFDITYLYAFTDVPPVFQRYIIASAAVRAAVQLVSNTELVKLLTINKEKTRANAIEYDCEIGDHSFFGLEHEVSYRAYQPYNALAR